MNLNNLTQMLQKMQQGGLNPQQQNEFQRLSQQQELIGKSLQQLNQEAKLSGQSSKLPGDLDDIVKQMQEVITDMNTEKLDDELIQKQENILSRMLDAQRSINERDFEKERKSRSGVTTYRESLLELNHSDNKTLNKIKDELNKAVNEGYSRDYEELIRRYYEALQSEQIKN
jgi:Skp family chaperone for outer membrane proteins